MKLTVTLSVLVAASTFYITPTYADFARGIRNQIATLDGATTQLADKVSTAYIHMKTGPAGIEENTDITNLNLGSTRPDLIADTAISANGVIQVLVSTNAQVSGLINGIKITLTPRVCISINNADASLCPAAVFGIDAFIENWTCAVESPNNFNPTTYVTADGIRPGYFTNVSGILRLCGNATDVTTNEGVQIIV